jgi:hypothetical protein
MTVDVDASSPQGEASTAGRLCTLRDPALARAVLAALVAVGVFGAGWLAWVMVAGPWLADSLLVELTVAAVTLLAGVGLAVSLSRALGCGHCHTPDCTCPPSRTRVRPL